MCLRAQSLPLTYLYRCLSRCVVGGRLISTQLSPASVQFPVPNPAKGKTGRDAGFGDKKQRQGEHFSIRAAHLDAMRLSSSKEEIVSAKFPRSDHERRGAR